MSNLLTVERLIALSVEIGRTFRSASKDIVQGACPISFLPKMCVYKGAPFILRSTSTWHARSTGKVIPRFVISATAKPAGTESSSIAFAGGNDDAGRETVPRDRSSQALAGHSPKLAGLSVRRGWPVVRRRGKGRKGLGIKVSAGHIRYSHRARDSRVHVAHRFPKTTVSLGRGSKLLGRAFLQGAPTGRECAVQ